MLKKGFVAKIPFSPAESQESGLLAECAKLKVYSESRPGETWAECLKSFREAPGELWVFGGYRIFGGSRDKIMATLKDLKRRKIIVVDRMNGERSDINDSEMLDRALRQIHGNAKVRGSSKFAKKIGAQGGTERWRRAQERKNAILAADIVQRLAEAPELSWRRKAEILGKPWTASSLFRQFGKD